MAGGSGTRMGSEVPKQFLQINQKPILQLTIEKFYQYDTAIDIIVVLPKSQIEYWKNSCVQTHFNIKHQIVEGGNSRFQSVKNGLLSIKSTALVAIHDGVRPFVDFNTIDKSFASAEQFGNGIASVALKDSIRIKTEDDLTKALDRSKCYLMQTPQTFRFDLIKKAFEQNELPIFTDDASVLEYAGEKIRLTQGSYTNIKITTKEDLVLGETFLKLGY